MAIIARLTRRGRQEEGRDDFADGQRRASCAGPHVPWTWRRSLAAAGSFPHVAFETLRQLWMTLTR